MIERVDSGEIDEVWLFGHPYGGYGNRLCVGRGPSGAMRRRWLEPNMPRAVS